MEIKSKNIKIVDVDAIIVNPRNRNIHPEDQIERLAKLIRFQGFRVPLIVSNRSGFLVVGHARLAAAKKVGLKEVPVIYEDFENEAQEYAFVISDNEIARWASLDGANVKFDIAELDLESQIDLDTLGLSDVDFEIMMNSLGVDEVNKGDENDEWAGLPEFTKADKDIKLTIVFPSAKERELFVLKHELPITAKNNNQWTSRL